MTVFLKGAVDTRSVPGVNFAYDLWGQNPVRALGDVRGREFQFRTTDDGWEIEIADHDKPLPSDGGEYGHVRRETCADAHHMSHEQAVLRINTFLSEYVAAAD